MVKMEGNEGGLDDWKGIRTAVNSQGFFSGLGNDDHFVGKSFPDNDYDYVYGHGYGNNCSDDGRELRNLSKSGVSIAEKRALKCGFNAAKISTPRFRTNSPLPSPGSHSPRLTIPAGISPHELLDSPILLPNSQLSPTTGTFGQPLTDMDFQMLTSTVPADVENCCDGSSSSMCNPNVDDTSFLSFHDLENKSLATHADCQPLTSAHPPMDFEFPARFSEVGISSGDVSSPVDMKVSDGLSVNSNSTLQPLNINPLDSVQMPPKIEPFTGDDSGNLNPSDGDQKEIYSGIGTTKAVEDGFNWRKYGQKQVKGSDYPRSYYKCTHPNCTVKKKVERSHDGQITEIIYKNTHNHSIPQPCRKSPFGSLPFNEASDMVDGSSTYANIEGSTVWRNIQPDWRMDTVEASEVTEVSDPLSSTQGNSMGVLESAGTPELSSTLASQDEEEQEHDEAATTGTISLQGDPEIGSDSKRRKKDGCFTETTLGTRDHRQQKVVVQIESEVDILDDGYRWRKYGQKVVKGNPNPRSYYKCTSAGCNVRKHVERASHDLKFVITTYEGKHTHEVPAARNGNPSNLGGGSLPPASATTQSTLTFPRNPHFMKPEPQDLPPHYDARWGCSNDLFRPNFFRPGAPSLYQMRFPTLPHSTPYTPFGLSGHPPYTNGIMPAIVDLPIPLPIGFPRSMANFSNPERPISSSYQSIYMGQQMQDNDVKLFRPKQEQRDESFCDTDRHNLEHSNSSVYKNTNGDFSS